ncbi:MAG: hypothetical protein ACI9MS_002502 [Glaciecola sp.]|jgi:hypothetical protein
MYEEMHRFYLAKGFLRDPKEFHKDGGRVAKPKSKAKELTVIFKL